jgi:hypothetical protein
VSPSTLLRAPIHPHSQRVARPGVQSGRKVSSVPAHSMGLARVNTACSSRARSSLVRRMGLLIERRADGESARHRIGRQVH